MKSRSHFYINLTVFFSLFLGIAGIRFLGTPPEAFSSTSDIQMLVFISLLWAFIQYLVFFSWNLGFLTLKRYQEERGIVRKAPLFGGAIITIVVSFVVLLTLLNTFSPPVEVPPITLGSFWYDKISHDSDPQNFSATYFNRLGFLLCNNDTESVVVTTLVVQTFDGTQWSIAPLIFSFVRYTIKSGGCYGNGAMFTPVHANPIDYRFIVIYTSGDGQSHELISPLWSEQDGL